MRQQQAIVSDWDAFRAALVLVLGAIGVGIVCVVGLLSIPRTGGDAMRETIAENQEAVQISKAIASRTAVEHQEFFDTDGDPDTGYATHGIGADYVRLSGDALALSAEHGLSARNGWGAATVPVHVEGYEDGRLTCSCNGACVVVIGMDADGDGDIDLQDFFVFQRAITGPRD